VSFDYVGLDPGWDCCVHAQVAGDVLSNILVVAHACLRQLDLNLVGDGSDAVDALCGSNRRPPVGVARDMPRQHDRAVACRDADVIGVYPRVPFELADYRVACGPIAACVFMSFSLRWFGLG
jgi:hypothetical protein